VPDSTTQNYIIEKRYLFFENSYCEIISRYTQFLFCWKVPKLGKRYFYKVIIMRIMKMENPPTRRPKDIKRSKRDENVYQMRACVDEIFWPKRIR
jgi:hypothetical protein